MKTTKFFTLAYLLLSSFNAWSKGIVISDIDDTLKMSHVTKTSGMAARAFMTSITFKGMPELMQEISKSNKFSSFYYVSSAPEKLMKKSHSKFITSNNYPLGMLILRTNETSETHKLNTIRNILEKEQPQEVLLFGDNGELDSEIYEQIESEFPNIKFTIFIHHVYDKNAQAGQHSFTTAVEPLLHLIDQKVLGISSYLLVNKLSNEVINESNTNRFEVQYFPHFMTCKNYNWSLATRDLRVLQYQKLIEKIETRCP
ncbi:MAG: hypothetical protein OHK0056_21000 [Bacteriovoracaceae bacterium]